MRELLTTQSQACWKERIQREAAARVAWKLNYGHKYLKEGRVLRKQPLPSSALRSGLVPATCSPDSKEVCTGWPETKGVQNQLSRAVGGQSPLPKGDRAREVQRAAQGPAGQTRAGGLEMQPAPPRTLQLLFQGISHDSQGRARYLRERYRQKPQEKFRYPILSSWDYGWHMEDAMKDTKAPIYAKSQPITKIFYLKGGIFHFPRRTDQLM
ncbi:protein ATP6V1FNB [Elephas maximus indicus]|uniref:protein ATP6V1FNB n=1 Tax=Elephas maximus indicus TaxID=99487 RepID=UPI00211629DC|nr:protein ATP6V1FNB [Elephas maximus indicus]